MKLELEANNLRSDNARLMTALQESVAKMQEYTTQLALYKEDNSQLKKRVSCPLQHDGIFMSV